MSGWGLRHFFRAVQDLCFPPRCLGCSTRLADSRPPLFCADCQAALRFPRSPLCSCCGLSFPAAAGGDHLCGACLAGQPFHRARAVFFYTPGVAKAIHDWKYGRTMAGLTTFAHYFRARQAHLELTPPDLIVPVPLHPKRLRYRGFNQSLLLARAFFPEAGERLRLDLLERQRSTPPQTGLSGEQRRRNMQGAFRVTASRRVAGRTVLLLDDVLTTGATVSECARVLTGAEAAQVQVLTLARVPE